MHCWFLPEDFRRVTKIWYRGHFAIPLMKVLTFETNSVKYLHSNHTQWFYLNLPYIFVTGWTRQIHKPSSRPGKATGLTTCNLQTTTSVTQEAFIPNTNQMPPKELISIQFITICKTFRYTYKIKNPCVELLIKFDVCIRIILYWRYELKTSDRSLIITVKVPHTCI